MSGRSCCHKGYERLQVAIAIALIVLDGRTLHETHSLQGLSANPGHLLASTAAHVLLAYIRTSRGRLPIQKCEDCHESSFPLCLPFGEATWSSCKDCCHEAA